MKVLKIVFICLIFLFKINCIFGQAKDIDVSTSECVGLPELFINEITNDLVVHYLWSYEGDASFYILQYKGIEGCIPLEFGIASIDGENGEDGEEPVIDSPQFEICPPDVWTEVPGPNLKTNSTNSASYKNINDQASGLFKLCMHFEFRMKVVCNNDTLYSDAVPYFYNDGSCSSCQSEMTVFGNHEADMIFQVKNHLSSNVNVLANITYKAGDRIELRSGFSTKPGVNFKAVNESCIEPEAE